MSFDARSSKNKVKIPLANGWCEVTLRTLTSVSGGPASFNVRIENGPADTKMEFLVTHKWKLMAERVIDERDLTVPFHSVNFFSLLQADMGNRDNTLAEPFRVLNARLLDVTTFLNDAINKAGFLEHKAMWAALTVEVVTEVAYDEENDSHRLMVRKPRGDDVEEGGGASVDAVAPRRLRGFSRRLDTLAAQ
ncbi:unnamed protein product [Spirodela intermedia]|uniref:Uncharacterized protein n=1 Tax=Spirodela intermedia TaxID=51605 RepID=A0A7I8IFT0_SPIIN|nr:unnamed protein product [Spirodela intermedia]CAA6656657.1 unnamed protein product [Spirodela intermedia]